MKSIDWSKAPIGATHFDLEDKNWLQQFAGISLVWDNSRGWADHHGQYGRDLSKSHNVIARPAVEAPCATNSLCPGHGRAECVSWPGYTAVDMSTAAADGYRDGRKWNKADEPPAGEKDLWTRRVTGFTNLENSFSVSYFHSDEGGVWQRPKAMEQGEQIILWTEHPEIQE